MRCVLQAREPIFIVRNVKIHLRNLNGLWLKTLLTSRSAIAEAKTEGLHRWQACRRRVGVGA